MLIDPSRADAATLAAELYLEQGRGPEAIELLEKHLATVKDRTGQIALRLRIADLALHYRRAGTIHLVMDNLSTHSLKMLTDTYGERLGNALWRRFTVHYTPKHGSWLNQAEIEISLFSRQCLGKRRIPDLESLRQEAAIWNRRINRAKLKINWHFYRKAARRKFGYKPNSFTRSKT